MTTATETRHPASPLDEALDLFRIKQAFNVIVRARDLLDGVWRDIGFVDDVRRAAVPVTTRRRRLVAQPFAGPPARGVPPLTGRVAVVSTGGSGAMASLVGVARALEETGTQVSAWSLCSGGAIFGFPLAAGMPAADVAELTSSMEPRDYVDPSWTDLAKALLTGGRGWAGIIRGDKIEALFRREFGDRTLGELQTPAYAPIWNIETNTVAYLGPRTFPDVSIARAIRMAISLPLFVQPAVLDGRSWCDGGLVDILPVHPVLDIEPPMNAAVVVNGFYPSEFTGEDGSGWQDRRLSVVHVGSQVRTSQHVQLARENLARLRAALDVLLVEPVPYRKVRGTGFYQQWLDTSEWPQFMRAGREETLDALRRHASRGARRGALTGSAVPRQGRPARRVATGRTS